MKKKFAVIGSLLVAGMVLTACGGKKAEDTKKSDVEVAKTGMPIVKDKLDMKLMIPGMAVDYKDRPGVKGMEATTNIRWEYINPPQSDFGTKLNLAFASGELPDAIMGAGSALTPSMQIDYGKQGLLVPLEDMLKDYAPNLSKILDEYPEWRKSITTPDGHIYTLPRVFPKETSNPSYLNPLWYNDIFMKKVGATDVPKTTDELYDLLVKFRDSDANGNGKKDEVPLSDGNKLLVIRTWMLPAFGMKAWGIEEQDGKVRYAPASEDYKAYLTYMNKLYKDKLLDQEVFSQSGEQFAAKVNNDLVGLYEGYDSHVATDKEGDPTRDKMFMQLTSEVQKTPLAPGHPRLVLGGFSITNKAKSPEAALRWADYLYSPEGWDMQSVGQEGTGWKYETNKEGKKVRVTLAKNPDKAAEEGFIGIDYGMNIPGVGRDVVENGVKGKVDDPDRTKYADFRVEEIKKKISPYEEVAFPITYMTKEENDEIADVATDITTYVEQMEAKFITGVEPLSNWDTYVETLNKLKVDKYIKVYQSAYDRWKKA